MEPAKCTGAKMVRRVSAATRRKVLDATADLRYVASPSAAGCDLLLYSLGTDVDERRRAFSGNLLRKRVGGVLVLGLQPDVDEAAALSAAGAPVAIVGAAVPGWASVRIDDVAAARCAMRHLLDLGHRRIDFIGGEPDDPLHSAARADRRRGYHLELAAAGVPADPSLEAVGGFVVRAGGEGDDGPPPR